MTKMVDSPMGKKNTCRKSMKIHEIPEFLQEMIYLSK